MSYERVTEATSIADYCSTADCYEKCDQCYVQKMYDRLTELEDKIEGGFLMEMPCKVGDTVYEIFKNHKPPIVQETTIDKIIITKKGLRVKLSRNSSYETSVSSFGKTIFLTKAEAEKKLKELVEGINEI